LSKREKDRGFATPDFPEINSLWMRRTVDKETQAAIISEVKRISFHKNPASGLVFSCWQISPRSDQGAYPVKECDIDRRTGEMWIRHTKEGKERESTFWKMTLSLSRRFLKVFLNAILQARAGKRNIPNV